MSIRLIIKNKSVQVLSDRDIPISLQYNIADIKNPEDRKSNFSKTMKLPGSRELDELFANIFDVNVDITGEDFNPNKREPIKILQNQVNIFPGFLQLKKVNVENGICRDYEVLVTGGIGNIFKDIGSKRLDELDLSRFDHDWTRQNEQDSWDTQIIENGIPVPFALGNGYVYPMMDLGFDSDLSNFSVTEMFPAFYVKTYLDQIFLEAGNYTYNSNFLNSDLFKRLIIPYNRTMIELTQAEQDSRVWDVEQQTLFTEDLSFSNPGANPTVNEDVDFDTIINDPSGAVDLVSDEVTIQASNGGFYDILTSFDITAEFIPDDPLTNYVANCFITGFVQILKNGSPIGGLNFRLEANPSGGFTGTYEGARPATPPDTDYEIFDGVFNLNNPANVYLGSALDEQLAPGDIIKLRFLAQINSKTIPNNKEFQQAPGGVPNGIYDRGIVRFKIHNAKLFSQINNPALIEGDPITHDTIIPAEVKQREFLQSLIRMFNLYIEPDPDNPKLLNIEPRDDFFTDDVVDFSEKLDSSKLVELLPLGALESDQFEYRYAEDEDFWNKRYQDTYREVYGERRITVDNDFFDNEKETSLVFSPTTLVGVGSNDRVLSTVYTLDNAGNPEPQDHNIRILHYSGLLATAQAWDHTSALNPTDSFLVYPYAGHFDDPYDPTLDLNFGLPAELYYVGTFKPITPTINGLFNVYHKDTIDEITDVNSKVCKAFFLLDPEDIENLSFRKRYYFLGSYWRLQLVDNYQPNNRSVTKCTFLKDV